MGGREGGETETERGREAHKETERQGAIDKEREKNIQ